MAAWTSVWGRSGAFPHAIASSASAQPPQFKLDPRLARLLGIHTQTRSCIIQALWQYIKTNKLQDSHDKEYINCDKYFQQVRLKTSHLRCRHRKHPISHPWCAE